MKDPLTQSGADCRLQIDKPLVLIGLMGVGKTTVGRRLAKKLGLPFEQGFEDEEDSAKTEIFPAAGG